MHIPAESICTTAEKLGQAWMWGNLLGDKAWSIVFDNSKIKRFVPEFKAEISYAAGIRRTVEWFEAQKSRMTIVDDNNRFVDDLIAAWES